MPKNKKENKTIHKKGFEMKEDYTEKRGRLSTKIFFALFVILTLLSTFLFWATRYTINSVASDANQCTESMDECGETIAQTAETATTGYAPATLLLIVAIISLCFAILFATICFTRWIRRKSVSGGLFLTTAISTAIFLGTSHFLGALLPPVVGAFNVDPAATYAGSGVVLIIAQIGLFALWFGFLMLTIWLYVHPIKRVNKTLDKLIEGEKIRSVRIGKSKQYKEIEAKLQHIAEKINLQTSELVGYDSTNSDNPTLG